MIGFVATLAMAGTITATGLTGRDDRYLLIGSPTGDPFVAFVDIDRIEFVNSRTRVWLLEIYPGPNLALRPPAIYSLIRFNFDCQAETDVITDIFAYSETGSARRIASDDQITSIVQNTVVSRVADIACKRVPIDHILVMSSLEAARRKAAMFFAALGSAVD
jgi:hypothetical protein